MRLGRYLGTLSIRRGRKRPARLKDCAPPERKVKTFVDELRISGHGKRLPRGGAREGKVNDAANLAAAILSAPDFEALGASFRGLTADDLRAAAAIDRAVIDRFDTLASALQARWLKRINDTLEPLGLKATGPVKTWDAAIAKLDRWTAENAAAAKGPATLDELNDLVRARVDTRVLSHRKFLQIITHLENHLEPPNAGGKLEFVTRDFAQFATLADRTAGYRGRVNVTINEWADGRPGWAFDLQLGPAELSRFWEQPFKVVGSNRDFNLHEAVYKGLTRLDRPEQFARIGYHLGGGKVMTPPRPLSPTFPAFSAPHGTLAPHGAAIAAGRQAVERATREYETQLDLAIKDIRYRRPVDLGRTAELRDQISRIVQALQGLADLPQGLG